MPGKNNFHSIQRIINKHVYHSPLMFNAFALIFRCLLTLFMLLKRTHKTWRTNLPPSPFVGATMHRVP